MNSNPSLVLSHDNPRNTTLDCDALGIHYQVTSDSHLLVTSKTTRVHRWDRRSNQNILVAEWIRHNFHSDEFKFPNSNGGVTVPVKTFMDCHLGFATNEWSFVGNDGRRYTWQEKTHLVLPKKIFAFFKCFVSEDGREGAPIARYHGKSHLINAHNAYLELLPGSERTLDTLVLTFLYVEWKRREQKQAASAATQQAFTMSATGA
ncbi:hypothetical protein SCHPADRAFT_884837 [Schizopora paradoxa]|uniref:DUF6593 domain-containing protein n=1 Tax=Schizopora paradoxa TaxID=27342 RepID=A0A0H2S815_9AGAM|nr:hypothetical protein SCHPADRAFT_884837 [Schizopora paradoxa]